MIRARAGGTSAAQQNFGSLHCQVTSMLSKLTQDRGGFEEGKDIFTRHKEKRQRSENKNIMAGIEFSWNTVKKTMWDIV